MAYVNGMWVPESDSVAEKVTDLSKSDSPYMKQAEAAGVRAIGARGLQNSTLAVSAGHDAAIKSVLPIATADANITAQKNLSFQGFGQTGKLADQQLTGQKELQASEIAAGKERQAAEIAAADSRLTKQLTSNQTIADQEAQTKLSLQQLSGDIQKTIASMNISANQQDKAQSAALTAANIYTQNINAIIANKDIPAATRDAYMTSARNAFDKNLGVIEQLYNIDLDWGAGSGSPAGSGAADYGSSTSYGGDVSNGGYTDYSGGGGSSSSVNNSGGGAGYVAYTDQAGVQWDSYGNEVGRI